MANKKSLVQYVDFELILTGLVATLLLNLCYLALFGSHQALAVLHRSCTFDECRVRRLGGMHAADIHHQSVNASITMTATIGIIAFNQIGCLENVQ